MNENIGGERLFQKSEWCSAEELCGTEADIIGHPIMEEAFRRNVSMFQPKNRFAVLSLCTKTRPYTKTAVWKALLKTCEGRADLIVASNGGVIPLEFESEWPYLTYDAPIGNNEYDDLAVETLARRLFMFFTLHRYQGAVFLFLPHYRYRKVPALVCPKFEMHHLILPNPFLWHRMNRQVRAKNGTGRTSQYKSDGFTWYPLAHPWVISATMREIAKWE